jgi:transcription initiation factor IIE alpha subunit
MSAADILSFIEERGKCNIKDLAENLQIPEDRLERLLLDLGRHNLVEYDRLTGEVKLSSWLAEIDRVLEEVKPSIATIIIPKNQSIKVEEISIGNFTDVDLEINLRLMGKRKEIAICKIA